MDDSDHEIYERRRQECLDRAQKVSDPAITEVHRGFAAEYARKLAPAGSFEPHIPHHTYVHHERGFN